MRVGVADLARATACRGPRVRGERFGPTAEDGRRAHRRVQAAAAPPWEAELPVRLRIRTGAFDLEVAGRIDLAWRGPGDWMVEELKTTAGGREHDAEDGAAWQQLALYGGLLAAGAAADAVGQGARGAAPGPVSGHLRLRLTRVDRQGRVLARREQRVAAERLRARFREAVETFAERLRDRHRAARLALQDLETLPFPLGDLRPVQRRFARLVFRTLRDRDRAFVECPTGSGKTLGAFFAALHVLARDPDTEREPGPWLAFLTARTVGQRAAVTALHQLHDAGARLRALVLPARHRVCPCLRGGEGNRPCSALAEYYGRRGPAMRTLLRRLDGLPVIGAEDLAAVGRAHGVCPHALAHDLIPDTHLVVCDYHFAIGAPSAGAALGAARLLIDEAHHFPERLREACSAALPREALVAAAPAARRRHRGVYRALADTIAAFDALAGTLPHRGDGASGGIPWRTPDPAAVAPLLARAEALAAAVGEHGARTPEPGITALYDHLTALLGCAGEAGPGHRWLLRAAPAGRGPVLECLCIDAAIPGARVLAGAAVLFSGTLSPPERFREALGVTGRIAVLPPPGAAGRLGVFVVPDQRTRYRDRAAGAPDLARLVLDGVLRRSGGYLLFLSSYTWLEQVAGALRTNPRSARVTLVREAPGADDDDRGAFVDALRNARGAAHVLGLAVLGGSYAESLDLPGRSLRGVFVAGCGLAPPTPATALRRAVEARDPEGRHVHGPAMQRVAQAAGRVLRADDDRGFVCLIDDRFRRAALRRWLPAWWSPRTVPSDAWVRAVDAFWSSEENDAAEAHSDRGPAIP